jgi:uncharacterized membrane protein HdeD (DUF308 family)
MFPGASGSSLSVVFRATQSEFLNMATESSGLKTAKRFTGWYIAAAILFIVVGLFAIIEPTVAGLGVALLVGWLLIFGGIAHFISAFQGGGVGRVLWQILAAIVFVIGGLYFVTHPLMALGSLTLLLGAVILVGGIFEIITYFRLQREQPSGWMLANGILALILGGLIWWHWPSSSVWAIGTLVGVNLLFTGVTRLMLGVTGRRLIRRVTA